MEIANAFFCDAATLDANGKLNALGIFDLLVFKQFPTILRRTTFVFSISTLGSEINTKHKARIQLAGSEGQLVFPSMEHEISVHKAGSAHMIINFENVKFEKPGLYTMNIYIDAILLKSVFISVVCSGNRTPKTLN